MDVRNCTRVCCVIAAMIALSLTRSVSMAQMVEANGPVEIEDIVRAMVVDVVPLGRDEAAATDTAAPINAIDETSDFARSGDVDQRTNEGDAGPHTSATLESKALGRAAGYSSPQRERNASPASDGVLERLNPRTNDVTKVVLALTAVIGLILLLRTGLRRAGGMLAMGGRPSGVLEILARYPIGRGQQLIILKLARRIVLVHQAGSNMTSLSEMTDPDEVAALLARMEAGAASRDSTRFKKSLQSFLHQHESSETSFAPAAETGTAYPDAEVVDLTRNARGLSRWFTRKERS